MKVEFIDEDVFNIYYISSDIIQTELEMKILFRLLDNCLKYKYNYVFHGYYNVTVYAQDNILVLEFENIDDFGRKDFDITMYKNSVLLYEFYDADLVSGDKIFYDGKYYCEFEQLSNLDSIFEYGSIVYGDKVERILNGGILIKRGMIDL